MKWRYGNFAFWHSPPGYWLEHSAVGGFGATESSGQSVGWQESVRAWQRWWVARLHRLFPWVTRFMHFVLITYIQWLQAKGRKAHADKTAEGIRLGRRPTPAFIVEAILTIKRDNPRYSAQRIANIISGGELRFRIGRTRLGRNPL